MSTTEHDSSSFFYIANNLFKFQLFLLTKLPAAFIAGIRIKECNEQFCSVSVPFKWLTQNPFHSTYFACLSMAAEMSTGFLAMMHVYKRNPSVSMLVLSVNGNFHKKATGITTFRCDDGNRLREVIDEAIATGEGKTIQTTSKGTNDNGELVADFVITWSFKAKKK